MKDENELAGKLLAAVQRNDAAEARKIINEADIRRLPYSNGNMNEFVDKVRELYPELSREHHNVYWTAVHFLIVSDQVEESEKIHAIKTLITNSGFHMKQALTMKRNLQETV